MVEEFRITQNGTLEIGLRIPRIWATRVNVGLTLVDTSKDAGMQPAIPMFRPVRIELKKPSDLV
jgi:hypothetical protein